MDKKDRGDSDKQGEEGVVTDEKERPVCEKAFSAETDRSEDQDEPCADGVG